LQPGALRGPPATLAGDDRVAAFVALADQKWLQQAIAPDGLYELAQRLLVEVAPRLIGHRMDLFDRHLEVLATRQHCRPPWPFGRDQRGQPPPQHLTRHA